LVAAAAAERRAVESSFVEEANCGAVKKSGCDIRDRNSLLAPT
jgi:hypothetical protein